VKALLQGLTWRTAGLVLFESTLLVGTVMLAAWIRLGQEGLEFWGTDRVFRKALLIAAVCQSCFYFADVYNVRIIADRREMFVRTLQALGVAALLLGLLYFIVPGLIIGRGVFLIAAIMVIVAVIGWRWSWEWLSRRVGPRERVLIIGTNVSAVNLARELYIRQDLGVDIVGFISSDVQLVGQPILNPGVIGTIEQIPELVKSHDIDRVVVSLADARGKLPMDRLLDMKIRDGVTFDHLASFYEEYTGKIAVENLRPSWLIFSSGFKTSGAVVVAKRVLDVVVAGSMLVVLSPVMLFVAMLVRLTSPGAALYSQQRVGQNNQIFTIFKFRSMRQDAEAATGAVWAVKNDNRVTPIGRFIRATRLDELPQLWNVLRGDMSFVGPRPERPEFVTELTAQIPFYGQRHVVKPGLTGWAQVNYSYGNTLEDALEKLQYDLFYIKHLSLSLDIFIIFKTARTVLLRQGV
jgi:sugar transferase (PEP-CTERM system associated)